MFQIPSRLLEEFEFNVKPNHCMLTDWLPKNICSEETLKKNFTFIIFTFPAGISEMSLFLI